VTEHFSYTEEPTQCGLACFFTISTNLIQLVSDRVKMNFAFFMDLMHCSVMLAGSRRSLLPGESLVHGLVFELFGVTGLLKYA
jgi:hypothetical protein